jgi:putative ABC transport system permease protein
VSAFREAVYRVAGWFGLGRRDEDLAEELRFHEDMLDEAHRQRGLDARAARRAARLDLGGPAQIAERWRDQRGIPSLEMLRQDLRYGMRMLGRAPGFTAAAVTTLALGIGANTAIFTIVDAVLLRPLPYFEPDRLVTVGDRMPDGMSSNVGYTTVVDWQSRSQTFQSFALMRLWTPTLVVAGEAERVPAVRVSWNYFEMMGVRPALGRGFTRDEDRSEHWRVLLLSDGLWRRRFGGDPSIVGRTVVMNDRPYRVIGVMPADFQPLDAARYYSPAQLWAPIGYDVSAPDACRSCQHLRAFGRLKPGVTIAQAIAEMDAVREQLKREHPSDYETGSIAVVPLQRALTGNVRPALLVLFAAVGLVLLVACANVASLLLARGLTRQRELAVRAALGAGRRRIVRQLLTESALLSGLGAAAGVGLASLAARTLAAMAPMSVPRLDHVHVDARILGFTAIVALATTVVFGLIPAWRSASAGLQTTLALDSRGSVGNRPRARAAIVVADLVLALVLLAGAGLMLRTVAALSRSNPGFDANGVVTLGFSLVGKAYAEDEAVVAFQNRVLERVRALPGVRSAALAGQIPFGGNFDCWGFHARGRIKPNSADDPCIQRYGATPDFVRAMGIPIRAGRFFTEQDLATSQPVLVISESTARAVWGAVDPIGADVRLGNAGSGPWRRVIGVVGDTHHQDLASPPTAAMYTPQTQITDSFLVAVIKVSTQDPTSLVATVRSILRGMDPAVPVYDVASLEQRVAASAAERLFVMRLLSAFAFVAMLLAGVGLYSVVSQSVAARTREVGVRMALGAQRGDICALVLREGIALVGGGLALGLLAAVVATRYMGALVFGVSPSDPITLGSAAVLLVAVAVAAHAVPLRRALRIDPATALHQT